MKFFSGSPWLWSFSGHDVGPNWVSKWAASSAFKHLLFSCWSASFWQTLGMTCSPYKWGMLCLYSFFKKEKKKEFSRCIWGCATSGGDKLSFAFLFSCSLIKIVEIYFTYTMELMWMQHEMFPWVSLELYFCNNNREQGPKNQKISAEWSCRIKGFM